MGINKLLWIQRVEYGLFWGISFLLILAYEQEWLPQGTLVGNVPDEYFLQVAGVLLAIVLIPVALRLFNLFLVRKATTLSLHEVLVGYRRWSEVRLSLLLVVAVVNLSAYYSTINTTGLWCAGMAFATGLFCIPGRKQMMRELDLEQ